MGSSDEEIIDDFMKSYNRDNSGLKLGAASARADLKLGNAATVEEVRLAITAAQKKGCDVEIWIELLQDGESYVDYVKQYMERYPDTTYILP